MVNSLREGRIKGAALDEFAFSVEEIPAEIKDRLILTPHMGAHTEEAIENMGVKAAENVIGVLEGKEISQKYLVN